MQTSGAEGIQGPTEQPYGVRDGELHRPDSTLRRLQVAGRGRDDDPWLHRGRLGVRIFTGSGFIDLYPGVGHDDSHDDDRIVVEGTPADLVAAHSTLTDEHLAAYVGS